MVVLQLLYSTICIVGTVILATVIYGYFWYIKRNDWYWKKIGIKHVPFSEGMLMLNPFRKQRIHELISKYYKKYGKISGAVAFGNPTLLVGDPDLLKDVLIKDFHNFHYRRDMKLGDDLFDNIVMSMKGDDWKRVRTIITPVFTTKRLKMMTNVMNECAQTVMNEFEKKLADDGIIDAKTSFGAFTLDVIARAAFATRINSINEPGNEFVQHAKKIFGDFSMISFILMLFLPSWISRRIPMGGRSSWEFFRDVTLNVIKERKQKGKKYNDVLQLFMDTLEEDIEKNAKHETPKIEIIEDEEDQYGSIFNKELSHALRYKTLSQDEVIAQCVLFFSVGYETTAATLTFVAYSLALNPECQEKLIQEVDSAFRNHKEMSYDVIRDMKYLDCVVSETLRMYPALIMSERTASEDYELKDTGLTIEKGNAISFPIYAMHHDPEYFPEPEKFKPERFIEPSHHPLAYLPFGAGPRNCLGMRFALMEIKMCMSNILRHYRFKRAKNTKVPLEFKNGMGFLTVDDLPLKIEKRTDV
ncbi:cytochrome P450 3A24-like [Uloborus diversus]|uniref:cytochrome P450 3A24-like n=1 Tax=Uloborus diversus TaxID=327109 RepID=UPI00240A32AD|nr:cytochrome P450 3A24-like [Uloborus diversus]